MKGELVFWDVDTQRDFIYKDGKLYVPNAMEIIPNLKALTDYARENNIRILGSVDRHFKDDNELSTFPEHCMDNTLGQQKIRVTLLKHHVFIPSKTGIYGKYNELSNNEIQIYERSYRQILFEKQTTNVFDNKNVIKFLDKIRVGTAIVYGVATEYCVKDVVLGLLNLDIKVYLVIDAIKGIDKTSSEKYTQIALKEMSLAGAVIVKIEDVLKGGME